MGRAIQSNYPILSNIDRIIETKHFSFESILSQIQGTMQQGMCHTYSWVRRFYLSLIGSKKILKTESSSYHQQLFASISLDPALALHKIFVVHKGSGSVSNALNHITLCRLVHLKTLNSLKPKPLQAWKLPNFLDW